MSLLNDLRMYGRFTSGLPAFFRRRIPLAESQERVRRQVERRGASLLRLVERGVFGHTRSPYRALFQLAGCELGDVERMVRADGVEPALRRLREAGVYVTFDEFKGRCPIVRGGRELPVMAAQFDNPYLKRAYEVQTSGSTGAGTRIPFDLDNVVEKSATRTIVCAAHGVLGAPTGVWRGILPGVAGLSNILEGALMGNVPRRWFTPITGADIRSPLTYRLATRGVVAAGRLLGLALPRPEVVPLNAPKPIVDWMAATLKAEGRCLVRTFVSSALRIGVAALERGVDLNGATFMGGGEPPTPAKVREIRRTGARWVPNYATSEIGAVGIACANPIDENDLHVAKHGVALIQAPRQIPGWDVTVGAFFITSLFPSAPKLMLNVETDDCGVLERRACGCPLEALGLDEHVREIRSYRKLTGEGVSLVQTEVVRVLEEVLPAQYGGSSLDYQLIEEEDERGFTRLSLLVSPRVRVPDEAGILRTVLEALKKGTLSAAFAAAFWDQGGSLRLRREEPRWSAGGKFMPLCVAQRLKSRK